MYENVKNIVGKQFKDTFKTVSYTHLIAYCLDTNSFFITNQRHFFWEYDTEFLRERDAIDYFRNHIDEFARIRKDILSNSGGWKPNSDMFLENTRERFLI